ncbi:hypothetical protein HPB47_017747 [Ixodes persulcatus]|uniref:Uncharacterized protein n=1 Tax=Ixodes persulcatus TaxID=34615 RepID=A0AC60QMN3_IXOPE|nr:hypothetical protein HPB47_017747 [Ixodes persulcatus]
MTAAGNRPTGNMEPTGDTCRGTGGSGVLCNQENRSRWKQTQATRQKRLPTLPVDDYRVVIRPRDGLNFSAWTTNKITQAIIAMAQLSAAKMAQATIRIHRDQNLVVVSTPNMESSTRVQQISALTLGTKQYEVTAYLAVPDNSCRGVISGVETRPTAEELTENLRATGINILYARMMGQTDTAVITFEGIRVPRFVYLSGGEYPCRPYQPRQQVCGVCLGLGDRTDVCPQPEQSRCTTCRAPGGAMEDHECTAHCVNCGGEHPATDPRCPARQRAPYNKEHVARYLREKEQQRTPPSPPPPLPYNALASHHWPELPSYNRVNPDTTIPTNVEEKEYDRSSSGPPPGQPSHTKRNATQERNGYRRNPSDNANKAKTQSSTRSRSQQREREQQRRPDQQTNQRSTPRSPGHKGANQTGQMTRLGRTTSGRALLRRLGYRVPTTLLEEGRQKPAPPTIAAKVRVMAIPKNMHPQAHAGRRLARVRYLRKRYHHDPDALYTDTASYTSPAGCCCVAEGRHDRPLDDHARDSTRNPPNPPMDTYTQVTEYYRMSRRTYPPPHKSLTRQDATDWRKLQILSFPNLLHLHRFFPSRYRCECPGCHSPEPTLYHCTWTCPTPVGVGIRPIPNPSQSSWEAALIGSQPDLQLTLLDRARRVAQACGALDLGTQPRGSMTHTPSK